MFETKVSKVGAFPVSGLNDDQFPCNALLSQYPLGKLPGTFHTLRSADDRSLYSVSTATHCSRSFHHKQYTQISFNLIASTLEASVKPELVVFIFVKPELVVVIFIMLASVTIIWAAAVSNLYPV